MSNLLENNQEISNTLTNSNENELTNEKEQKSFLETTLGKTINTAIITRFYRKSNNRCKR